MRKFIAIVIAAVMLVSVLAGCSGNEDETDPWRLDDPDDPFDDLQDDQHGGHPHHFDFDEAFANFPPGLVMINAGEFTVDWGMLFFFLRGNINFMFPNPLEAPDWSEIVDNNVTLAESILEMSVNSALMYRAVEYGAGLHGVSLSAEDIAQQREGIMDQADNFGGPDMFLSMLWVEDGCHSIELYEYLISITTLATRTFNEIFGEDGELLPISDVDEFAAEEGYMLAKHILRAKPEDGEDTAIDEIEDILAQLRDYEGVNFADFFNDLMIAHSEDPGGLESNPDGYLFQDGDMVPEFHEATVALGIGEFSGIVESEFGYHIIYRLPLDLSMTPFSIAIYGGDVSLRYLAASSAFDTLIEEWVESMPTSFSPEFNTIDVAEMFQYVS